MLHKLPLVHAALQIALWTGSLEHRGNVGVVIAACKRALELQEEETLRPRDEKEAAGNTGREW